MRTIVAGGRDFKQYNHLRSVVDSFRKEISSNITIISGCARGADSLGLCYAREHEVPFKEFPADWEKQGRSAGFIRNAEMADYSDALIAFWDGKSKGTKHMIDLAIKKGLLVKVVMY